MERTQATIEWIEEAHGVKLDAWQRTMLDMVYATMPAPRRKSVLRVRIVRLWRAAGAGAGVASSFLFALVGAMIWVALNR